MKISASSFLTILICLTLLSIGGGCSKKKEEQPLPVPRQKIVKPIIMPVPKKLETPSPSKASETKAKETASAEDGAKDSAETSASGGSGSSSDKIETLVEEDAGFYLVKKGDSLAGIAGKRDVYNDPLKWPILYRHNLDKLDDLEITADFSERKLSEGLKLKILTPDEVGINLAGRPDNLWVINIVSATYSEKVVPHAVRLIKKGYPVYITSAKVKGKDWTRLRLGFFKDRIEADEQGKKIMTMFKLVGYWSTKVSREYEEFGGY